MSLRGRRIRCATLAGSALALIVCAPPQTLADEPLPFTEEASARGIDYLVSIVGFGARGVAFSDLDGDGDPDVVVTGRADQQVGLFENDGTGVFQDRTTGSGIPPLPQPSGVISLDYDADGDLDLFFTQGYAQPNRLVRNVGGFHFADVTASAGVGNVTLSEGAAAADFDGDGWVDICIANYGFPNNLFRNLGNGTFEDVAAQVGVDDPWRGFQVVFFDADRDRDSDLYVSNDKHFPGEMIMHNRFYENVGGTFIERSAESGTDANMYSMGVAVGDFDGNLLQDLYCTNVPFEPNYLFLNRDGKTFDSAAASMNVESFRLGWGALFFDYDNDGYQELYVCNQGQANRLYYHGGLPSCTDIASALGVADTGASFCIAAADVDDDGDQDLLLQNNLAPIKLYINNQGQNRHWVKFRIIGSSPNGFAVGAVVDIHAADHWQTRGVIAGSNFKSQNDLVLHFGVDKAILVNKAVVRWPNGATRTLENLRADRTHVVEPLPVPTSSAGSDPSFEGITLPP